MNKKKVEIELTVNLTEVSSGTNVRVSMGDSSKNLGVIKAGICDKDDLPELCVEAALNVVHKELGLDLGISDAEKALWTKAAPSDGVCGEPDLDIETRLEFCYTIADGMVFIFLPKYTGTAACMWCGNGDNPDDVAKEAVTELFDRWFD